MKGEATTIMVLRGTREELKQYGRKGETYDQIIARLLELAQKSAFHRRQKLILESGKFVPLEKV